MSQIVLITGGSSGIGFSMSTHFARAGFRLLWVSLSQEELDKAAKKLKREFPNCEIYTLEKDLSSSTGAEAVYQWTMDHNWQVDVLINNAGFGNHGLVKDIRLDKELAVIQVNLINTFKMTHLFLSDMIERDHGTIINISSNSSFQPTPLLNTYGSTKAFVTHFTRGLTEELRMMKSKVKTICVCPAAIRDTNFRRVNNMDHVKTFSGIATTSSEEVARDVWNAYRKGKDFMVTGWKMRALYAIKWLFPYRFTQFLVQNETRESNNDITYIERQSN